MAQKLVSLHHQFVRDSHKVDRHSQIPVSIGHGAISARVIAGRARVIGGRDVLDTGSVHYETDSVHHETDSVHHHFVRDSQTPVSIAHGAGSVRVIAGRVRVIAGRVRVIAGRDVLDTGSVHHETDSVHHHFVRNSQIPVSIAHGAGRVRVSGGRVAHGAVASPSKPSISHFAAPGSRFAGTGLSLVPPPWLPSSA